MIGTFVNVATVIIGSSIGLLIHTNLPENIKNILFQGIGLFTLYLGISMSLKSEHLMIVIFSIVLGVIAGELLKLESRMEAFGDRLKKRFSQNNTQFTEGMITAFLLFCMGSMTILGAFEEGLQNYPNLLLAKSLLDGVASIALASTFGIGVMFSVIPLLIYQGGLTLLASSLENIMTNPVINEMTAVGGILMLGLALEILNIKKIKTLNMLPAIFFAVILAIVFI
ncbi:MAG: DUF554 domain-containing protein [Candidatus Marinimicrobia bacterium]|nr:DUF554 domain-containing protein [Candidatus Neomarinimicrobiota bacterium]